jgi:hypothetical protein
MDPLIDLLWQSDAYILNVLLTAWRAFAEATRIDPAGLVLPPGMLSLGTLVGLAYAYVVTRR